jgi:hypothetical protein
MLSNFPRFMMHEKLGYFFVYKSIFQPIFDIKHIEKSLNT